jgi:pyridoxal phosphate enzyme (YggS family)
MATSAGVSNVRDRLAETRNRIASVAMRYGREPDSVRLIAVSKTQSADAVRAAAAFGQMDFGENYLQEALPKLGALADLPLTWHFIGQLQGNKTRAVAENFHWVHTLDRERIAVRLNEQRHAHSPPLNVCIQVRLEDEPGKGGISKTEVLALARTVLELPRLRLRGLMCIPPQREGFEAQRQLFAELADCARALREQGMPIDTLSMGMSGDLEAAVAAGATCVRIGTAIFGERK